MEKKEIKIKSVQADEIAVSTKMTIYCVVSFYSSGVVYPRACQTKREAEEAAFQMTQFNKYEVSIYKFEIDVPKVL